MRQATWKDRGWCGAGRYRAAWAVMLAGVLGLSTASGAADVTPAQSASETISEGLRKLLDGAAPRGIADLKAMQEHVQKLSEQVKKCTVGVQVGPAWGSGVIISKDGYVLTAAHVAGKPNLKCKFTMADGKEVDGITLGMFRTLDAGLMKITDEGDYAHAELGNSSELHEGQWCIAMGHPGGYQSDRGAVLRLGRVLLVQKDAITTDCTLVGGDSGGPLFDMEGRVIGINSRIAELLTTNMHVPVNTFHEMNAWDRLVSGEAWGHMPGREPWLGVVGDAESVEAKIASIKEPSPAQKAKLAAGDIVIAFNGREIADFAALTRAVSECQAGQNVKLRVRRGSEMLDLDVKLGKKG